MTMLEAMEQRHSVRNYQLRPLESEHQAKLQALIAEYNQESGLHIQLVTNEPKAFDGMLAHYGLFAGVTNYIAMVGRKGSKLEETCGYYGEKLVLEAQRMGLNTCWVALTYKKIPSAFQIDPGEKLCIVIAIGYGTTQGKPHRSRPVSAVTSVANQPQWFQAGIRAALLAPTAVNQQKFHFGMKGNQVTLKAGFGMYSKIDLGIVKYHFELGAGKDNFEWA